ncbi:MAG TPA: hypothetical protein VNY05_03915 [Candidatus Acidoferrales bacterium]|jgi:hypothetical protein|nr:hypothetical protein [Candidatus Acidoferrales bacterium]
MMRKVLLSFGLIALAAVAGVKSYTVSLFVPTMIGSEAFAPGEYQVAVVDQKAVIRNGKLHGEFPVKVEENGSRYGATTVRYSNGDGKMHVQEIHLGGTKTKLVFNE